MTIPWWAALMLGGITFVQAQNFKRAGENGMYILMLVVATIFDVAALALLWKGILS